MKKVVAVVEGPAITETGVIARLVKFDDGSGQVQAYRETTGWSRGGTSLFSMTTAEAVTVSALEARGLTKEQIAEVLSESSGDK